MSDVCTHGLSGARLGGVFGVDGTRTLLFDADGTRQAVRQRALPQDPTRPSLHRRAQAAAPGYRGRKRGEAVRSRMTVQQRHTSEWLGTFGMPGNSDAYAQLGLVCAAVVQYLKAHEVPLHHGVVRLDGEHGWVHQVAQMTSHGLGYLLRCADYPILRDPCLQKVLAAGAIVRLRHADSGLERELFDVPAYHWSSLRSDGVVTRLLIARHRATPGEKPAVGKLLDGWIYELIVTDRPASVWDAACTYTLYQDRGTFETTLAQEDQELPTDRWVTFAHDGQELWQILCQWVWNLRVRAAATTQDTAPPADPLEPDATAIQGASVVLPTEDALPARTATDAPSDADALPTNTSSEASVAMPSEPAAPTPTGEPSPPPAATEPRAPAPITRVPAAFGSGAFERLDAHTVRCPAGVVMHPSERVMRRIGECVRYQAPPKACAPCALAAACRGHTRRVAHGHRLTLPVWRDTDTTVRPTSPTGHALNAPRVRPVDRTPSPDAAWEPFWKPTDLTLQSLHGSALRRGLRDTLRGHRLTITVPPATTTPRPPPPRSHRRTAWLDAWSRNARTAGACRLTLAGVPAKLAAALGLLVTFGA